MQKLDINGLREAENRILREGLIGNISPSSETLSAAAEEGRLYMDDVRGGFILFEERSSIIAISLAVSQILNTYIRCWEDPRPFVCEMAYREGDLKL